MNLPRRHARHQQAMHQQALHRPPGLGAASAAESAQMGEARPRLHVHIDTLSLPDAASSGTDYADAVRSALASALAGRRQPGTSGPEATARAIADAVRAQMRIRRV
jgi:hypothetical protein